jgi:hypothetical protein
VAFDQARKPIAANAKVDAFVCLDAWGGKGVAKAPSAAHVTGKTQNLDAFVHPLAML